MTLIIGIAGRARVGKDTFSEYFQKYAAEGKLDVKIYSFAKAVKQVVVDTFNIPMEIIEEYKIIDEPHPETQMPMRKMLQFIGDGFRKFKNTVWIEKVIEQINKDGPDIAVISDVRYENEACIIQSHGGLVILVHRKGTSVNDDHPSETTWLTREEQYKVFQGVTKIHDDIIDYFINNGDIKLLMKDVENFLYEVYRL